MKITEILPAKGKLFEIAFEDGSRLYLHADLLYEAGLREGDSLDAEHIAALRSRAAEHRSYEYGLYLLEKRSYSYRELYDKLMGAPHAQEDAVLAALQKLMRYGFLDDARYAESLARHYVEGKKYGLRRAAYEMKHRGLSQEDIESALAPYDTPEQISEMLLDILRRRYARVLTGPEERDANEKVTAALMRRGFAYQQIRYALEDYYAALEEAQQS